MARLLPDLMIPWGSLCGHCLCLLGPGLSPSQMDTSDKVISNMPRQLHGSGPPAAPDSGA